MWDFLLGAFILVAGCILVSIWPPSKSFEQGFICGFAALLLLLRICMWVNSRERRKLQ